MKKLFKIIMVLALAITCLMQSTLVNADENGSITITNAEIGKTYSIYKLFDLESYSTTGTGAYTYTIDTNSKWYDFVENGDGKTYITLTDYEGTKKIVSWNTSKNTASDHAKFAKLALAYAKAANPVIAATATKTSTTTTVEFTNLDLGYYLIDSSLGALCGLTTTNPNASLAEKNSVPTIKKEVKEDAGNFGTENSAQIGDTVEFKTTITIGKGAINYTLYDNMSAGLTYNGISKVVLIEANDTNKTETAVANTNYTVNTIVTGYTFVINFKNEYINTLNSGDTLVVYYTAVLNANAIVAGNGNPNEATLKYGDDTNHTTEPARTITYTYEFDVVKTDEKGNLLDGAEFELYTSNTSTTPLKFTVTNGVYKVNPSGTTSTIVVDGKVTLEGLDFDTYYLKETKNPSGYNRLISRVSFTVGENNRTAKITDKIYQKENNGGIQVINKTGAILPSTGGMGTVLFIVIGSLMVLGFGVLLVTKLRISKMSI